MSLESTKRILNRTGAFSLQEKRHFRNILDAIYEDTGANQAALTTPAAAGITGGTGTVYQSSVHTEPGDIPVIVTRIFIDLTGLGTSTTDLDIIGDSTPAAHIGRITTAQNGVIFSGTVTCLETPTTGADDIDLYSATVGTGAFDTGIATLTETALLTKGAAWAAGEVTALTGLPPADDYLYLVNGEAGTVGVYDAGKILIELRGTTL